MERAARSLGVARMTCLYGDFYVNSVLLARFVSTDTSGFEILDERTEGQTSSWREGQTEKRPPHKILRKNKKLQEKSFASLELATAPSKHQRLLFPNKKKRKYERTSK